MSPNPVSFIQHLREFGYHPRSDKHSNALAAAIVEDLVAHCPKIRAKAKAGELVYEINFTVTAGTADWNVDLVFGAPGFDVPPPSADVPILQHKPSTVEIAIEIKSVMTEHRKAVKNRKHDLEAHHEHVHNYSDRAVAAGVLVIHASETFRSPLREKLTCHNHPDKLVEHCISELRAVAARGGSTGYGLEARCAIVVDISNTGDGRADYVTSPPAPQVGDPLHYDAFIQKVREHYTSRF
jgi:hypothetical protein